MCGALIQGLQDRQKKTKDQGSDLLIAEKDGEGRPVGVGGRSRADRIREFVDSANTGIQIPTRQ